MSYVEFNNYTKRIKKKIILDKISINLEQGKIYRLNGPNGSGKTMLLRALSGLIYPSEGTLKINNVIVTRQHEFPVSVGALIENPKFWSNYTGKEVLKYLASIQGKITEDEIDYNMTRMNMNPSDSRKIKEYSLGMLKKLGIVQAIMEKPDIILLDEPTNALDVEAIELLRKVIDEEKNRNALIVIVVHDSAEFDIEYDGSIEIYEGKTRSIS